MAFRFASSKEIKISIANLDINNYTFDLIVRNFDDTDQTASQTALERWSNLSLNPDASNYIGRVIGTTDESFPRKSMFITVNPRLTSSILIADPCCLFPQNP